MRQLSLVRCALLVLLGACGSEASAPAVSTVRVEDATFAPSLGVDLSSMTRTSDGLYYRDLVAGSGAEFASGHRVDVWYAGYLADGTLFDSRQASSTTIPFSFTLGAGQVIDGWDEGLVGLKVGGRRLLAIPPALAYGVRGNGPIPGNAVLVFFVDAVATH